MYPQLYAGFRGYCPRLYAGVRGQISVVFILYFIRFFWILPFSAIYKAGRIGQLSTVRPNAS